MDLKLGRSFEEYAKVNLKTCRQKMIGYLTNFFTIQFSVKIFKILKTLYFSVNENIYLAREN